MKLHEDLNGSKYDISGLVSKLGDTSSKLAWEMKGVEVEHERPIPVSSIEVDTSDNTSDILLRFLIDDRGTLKTERVFSIDRIFASGIVELLQQHLRKE